MQVGDEDKQSHGDRQSLISTSFYGDLAAHVPVGPGKLSFAPFTQFYSGDPPQAGAAQTGTAWQQLYPSLDQVVGLLQLFTQSNLLQNGGRVRWRPSETLSLEFNGRVSAARDNAPLPGFGNPTLPGDGGWRTLGTELDLLGRWQVVRSSEVFVGGGLFVPTEDVRKLLHKNVAGQVLLQWTSRF